MISDKKNVQYLIAFLKKANLQNWVLAPGSRNAPLLLSFTEDQFFNSRSVIDERSAAFFALGWAQKTQAPVGLCCSSGSALLNFYPAVAEAFYQKIPLLILSADRPETWIDQQDGQTIRQKNAISHHVHKAFHFEENLELILLQRQLNEAMHLLKNDKIIHINMPFAEPLYQLEEIKNLEIQWIEHWENTQIKLEKIKEFENIIQSFKKIVILVGQNVPDEALNTVLKNIEKSSDVVILSENLANISAGFLCNDEQLDAWTPQDKTDLFPEVLIVLAGHIVSKKWRNFFRSQTITYTFFFSTAAYLIDTFNQLSHQIASDPVNFLSKINFFSEKKIDYQEKWRKKMQNSSLKIVEKDMEAQIIQSLFRYLPKNSVLHLGNSLPIRYAQFFEDSRAFFCYCNRGTSGIEGSLSTAIGFAHAHEDEVYVLVGDLTFFYDSNAFWHAYVSKKLKIILMNNGGGGIFKKVVPALIQEQQAKNFEDFFYTAQQRTAENLAKDFKISYFSKIVRSDLFSLENAENKLLQEEIQLFLAEKNTAILEIFTQK